MRILSIETSCDDTAVALVDCKGTLRPPPRRGRRAQGSKLRFEVLKNIVSSQIKIHRPFGGVVPSLAKREHIKNLPKILKTLNSKSHILNSIDVVAVTVGPGLEPALWQGIEFAKNLAKKIKKPLIGVNHMEGHLYSNWLPHDSRKAIAFPAIALVVSGGHTILLKMTSLTKWKKLGETRDDAAGEAFDKVARMLGLPYPGGPEIAKLAEKGNAKAINFPRPMLKEKNYDFSFSGLKTAVLYYLRDADLRWSALSPRTSAAAAESDSAAADVAAAFQQAVAEVLISKTIRAAREFGAQSVLLCGGVSANKKLQSELKQAAKKISAEFFCPSHEYNTDNAAMIAAAAYIQHLRKKKFPIEANANLNL